MSGWQTAAKLADVPLGGVTEVMLSGALLVLVRPGHDDVAALAGLCPHAFARLGEGRLEADGRLSCPRHLARFDVRTGACVGGWAVAALKRYAVKIEDGAVWLPDPLAPLP